MDDSSNPSTGQASAESQHAATAPGGAAAGMDPVAVIRSKQYIAALVLAAIAGIPISAIAYGFLALVAAIQKYLFTELPNQVLGRPAPAWWPLPWLVLCGLVTGVDHPVSARQWGPLTRIRVQGGRRSADRPRAPCDRPRGAGHTRASALCSGPKHL